MKSIKQKSKTKIIDLMKRSSVMIFALAYAVEHFLNQLNSNSTHHQGCRSLLSIGGIICNFTRNFALFLTLGGMNLDHNFFQVSKLSKDQKKKGFHQKRNTFFPEFKWRPALRCTPQSNYWGICRCRPYSNYWGGYSQIIGGDIFYPSPPGFGTPARHR